MKESILIEDLYFDNNFNPPEIFDYQKCKGCPFYHESLWQEKYCMAIAAKNPYPIIYKQEKCPIHDQINKEENI